MKKSQQRLTLSRETLHFLAGGTLSQAAGGSIGPKSFVLSNCPACDSQISGCPMTKCVDVCTK